MSPRFTRLKTIGSQTLKFRSKFEKKIWNNAKKSKRKIEYEPQDSHLSYTLSRKYIPDFRLPNGILVEAKGRFTSQDRTKMLRVQLENPGLDIRLLFQRANNRLTKSPNSLMYWQWAERHGFEWAEGETIPAQWWKE
ncbi:MAG: putative endonuclease I [Prokaryotic dsDNA virus sp.]|uniref:hypothetical protein n=1 Tax=Thalassospira sp. TaxID=1912094 RepID=UPI000C47FEC9|nr:hypothetical protein [Thalassospira sp.]MAZ33904.1 hypothetical protein [Thalassospira sp.]MAZ34659.1 hypothetical protein [Thalassospira sp.]QDP60966.1 MAG: putative endonuclease I [Prokaryotic dsDNA virus sp.]QDP64529.1 MAG: putative endonuclease I [Prokaryotic dsDNA virus sp.]